MLPEVTTPFTGPDPVLLTDKKLANAWKKLTPENQALIIKEMERFIDTVLADGSPEFMASHCLSRDLKKDRLLEKFYWQLAKFYRYSTPSRIADAVPALEFVIEVYKRDNPGGNQIDIFPTLYLGVALSKKSGEEEKAIETFQEAFANLHKATYMPELGLIWARANYSRVLRKKNRIPQAKKQEKLIRQWILGHLYSMPPSDLKELVIEDGETDHVFSHPDIKIIFDQMDGVIKSSRYPVTLSFYEIQYNARKPAYARSS